MSAYVLLQSNELDEIKAQLSSVSKENQELKEELRKLSIARDKDAAVRSSLEKENKRMSSQLEAFGKFHCVEEIMDQKSYFETPSQLI